MKYVLIGTGNISKTYTQALANINAQLVACVSRSGKKPVAAPELPCFTTLEQINVDYDAVIILTPNGLHHQAIIAAANLGKHVLVEKPLDITVKAMDESIAACKKAGVTLAVAYQRRTNPDNLAVKALLASGALGKVFAANLACNFWRDQAYYDSADYRGGYEIDGGGPFVQQASHNIDNYIWFFGMPSKVSSELGTFMHKMEAEDHGAALLRHESGMIGTMIASTCAKPGYGSRLEVICEKGTFTLIDDKITIWNVEGIANPAAPLTDKAAEGANTATLSGTARHEDILKDFEEAVAQKREPLIGGAEGRLSTELILWIYGKR